MSLSDSIVLITSSDPANMKFGTGFLIYFDHEKGASYVVTCAHVVRDVCETGGDALVAARPASVVALGDAEGNGVDLAVLRMEMVLEGDALSLAEPKENDCFAAVGFRAFKPSYMLREIRGTLGRQLALADRQSTKRVVAFDLTILDDYTIQPGYSGAPVVRDGTKTVLAVVSNRIGEGQKGIAISVAELAHIWNDELKKLQSVEAQLCSSKAPVSRSIFISYRKTEPDATLARYYYENLKAAGHKPFFAGESIKWGEHWAERIATELENSDYFLLLLSESAAGSEMVTEEVKRARELRTSRKDDKPAILVLRLNLPMESPLNYDLSSYLNQSQQKHWKSEADNRAVLEDLLQTLAGASARGFEILNQVPSISHLENPAPLPIAPPELPEGQVRLDSKFYVERPPLEAKCFEAICDEGALIRIKAPRQMGKTSLMARILHESTKIGCKSMSLSFQTADARVFSDIDLFLRWFCVSIGRKLGASNLLNEYWGGEYGSKGNCSSYFEEHLLADLTQPVAIGLDEVDLVIQHPTVATDFLSMLRSWHEEAKNTEVWKKLKLIIVHSTEVYVPLSLNESPFNVGLEIELKEFTETQVIDLANRHGLRLHSEAIEAVMRMVGGHPYLIRLSLYLLARQEITLDALLDSAPTESGQYSDHLRRHLWNLEQHRDLAEAMKRVATSDPPVRLTSYESFQLESMGLVIRNRNEVSPRCNLYRLYFRDRLRNPR